MSPLSDQFHIGLAVPRYSASQIHRWALEQPWPEGTELEHPSDYHITLLFTQEGHQQHKDAWWIQHLDKAEVKVTGVTAFPARHKPEGGYAYVLLCEGQAVLDKAMEMQDRARAMGLDVPSYPGGYKIHLTVAYGPSQRLTGVNKPNFQFDVGPSSVSPRRPEKTAGEAMDPYGSDSRQKYNPDAVQVLDHLSMSTIAHNMHYKFEQGGMGPQEATQYAKQLLQLIGYPTDDLNLQATLQAWQTMYPDDKVLSSAPQSDALQAPVSTPTESYPTHVGATGWQQREERNAKQADYFHVAPTTERDRIKTWGLQPSKPMNNERWHDWQDWAPKWLRNQPEGVYVTQEPSWHWTEKGGPSRSWDRWRVPDHQVQQILDDQQGDAKIIPHVMYPELHAGGPETYEEPKEFGPPPEDWVNYHDWHGLGNPSDEEWKSWRIGEPTDPEKLGATHKGLSQTLRYSYPRPLYHWLDASDIHDWMDPSHTGPGETYLTTADNPENWNADVPMFDNPVRLTIDPTQLDERNFDQTYNGWLENYLYHGVVPPEAVTDIKGFKRPDSWDDWSTVPSEVNNPEDHWPDWGQTSPSQDYHEIQFSNDAGLPRGSSVEDAWYHSTDPKHRQNIRDVGLTPDERYKQIWLTNRLTLLNAPGTIAKVGGHSDPDVPSLEDLEPFIHDGNECYEVARGLASAFPNLAYREGRWHRALDDGTGQPDIPGHAWVQTPQGTIIDTAHAQFEPDRPVVIAQPGDITYERYIPHEYDKDADEWYLSDERPGTIAKVASDDPVERWVSQGQVLPYAQHDPAIQKAIHQYMAVDGEAWDPDMPLERYIQQYGQEPFGITHVPAQELLDALNAHPEHGPDWLKSYGEFSRRPDIQRVDREEGRGVPEGSTEIWPVILDRHYGDILEDGWHRAYHYLTHGIDPIPAIYYP